jgi:hypothetical protein
MMLLALAACAPVISPPTNGKPDKPGATVQPQEISPMPQKPPILNETVGPVVWADSSLGCPEPGAMYMQGLQEGMRIRLQVGEQVYQYHSSTTRKPFLCQDPAEPVASPPITGPATRNPGLAPAMQATEDLAARLQIGVEQIEVVRSVEVDWPDGSLGCPQPGMRYPQVVVNGTFIQLRVGDQMYNYHSGSTRPPFLCISKDELLPEDLPEY